MFWPFLTGNTAEISFMVPQFHRLLSDLPIRIIDPVFSRCGAQPRCVNG